jgi:hypothetical protein
MDLGTALLNTFVVLAVGTALAYLTNDRFKVLRHEIDGLRTSVAADITELRDDLAATRTELRDDIVRLETRLDSGLASLRSDLTQVALAVGAKGRTAQA